MTNLGNELAAESVEHPSETVITTCDDQIPRWQWPCLQNTIGRYGMFETLDFLQTRKLVLVDTIFKIRNHQELSILVERRIAAVNM